jgi:hemerythrin
MKIDRQLFRIGIPLIDNQHEAYLDLLDDLFAAGEEPVVDRNKVDEALKRACAYGIEHLDAEEMLMASVNYPALDGHRKKHNEFRERVEQLVREGKDLPPDKFLHEVNKWMLRWFCEQTETYDRALAQFLKKRNEKK